MGGKGSGWHGDTEGHQRAGEQSTGNPNAAENLSQEDRQKGGENSRGGGRPSDS